MRIAIADLSLDRLFVVYPGATSFSIDENVEVIGAEELPARLTRLQ